MPSLLLSGPAGGGKSAAARELLAERSEPTIMIDFQRIYAGLLGIERLPDGRFPERLDADGYTLPLAEYVRRAAITGALAQGLDVIVTNSDGDPERRAFLLGLLGPGPEELVLDPGLAVVSERLSVDGALSDQCRAAIGRWYGRLGNAPGASGT